MAENSSTRAQTASLGEHFRRPQLFLTVLSAFTFIIYSISLSFQFVWDDIFQIVDNPLIRSWSNIPKIFLSDLWTYTHRSQLYYRPLFTTWSVLNYSLFRLNPRGWHLGAILLHIVAILVVYGFARRLKLSYWTSVAAATIFALHPIHIECVSWISAASDTMVTIFYVLAFSAFLRFRDPNQAKPTLWRITSLVLLTCALLTKEMAVTFCGLVAVYVWLFPAEGEQPTFAQRVKAAVVAALPYLAVTIAYFFLRKYAMGAVMATPNEAPLTAGQFLLTLPYVLAYYLRLLVFPIGLTALYYTPHITTANLGIAAMSVCALVGYAAAVWYLQRRTGDKTTFFLALWPLLTLGPALYLPNFHDGDFVRDRYAYLPSVGFVLLVAQGISLLPAMGKMKARSLQASAVVLIALAFVAGSTQQGYWQNEHSVFERGYKLYPDNLYAKVGLAKMLQREGEAERSIQLLTEATAQAPRWAKAYYLLAEAYSRVGKQEEGRRVLAMAVSLLKDPTEGELDAADLAGLYGRLGNYQEGELLCGKVLSQTPDLLSALYNCGVIDYQVGKYVDAEQLLSRAVNLTPGEPSVVYWLGRVHLKAGQIAQSRADFSRAVSTRPDVAEYHFWLGQSLESMGNVNDARLQYTETLRLDPSYEAAKIRLQALGAPDESRLLKEFH